jgi:nucleotide-binding universal stress UspA family protein
VNQRKPKPQAARIVVGLDASSQSLVALEEAAELAAWMGAELLGLFVEDVELLRLATSPVAREILYPSAQERPLDTARMESKLRAQAEQARRALERVAERVKVPWDFRVVRGEVAAQVLLAAAEADLLSLGRVGWSLARRWRVGSTARAALGARTSLLVAQRRISRSLPVSVVYDRSPGCEDAVRVAARLAKATSELLTVFLLADSSEAAKQIHAEADRALQGEGVRARFHWLDSGDEREVLERLQAEKSGMVVLGAGSPLLEDSVIEKLLCQADKPVLIVGSRLAPILLRITAAAMGAGAD